MDLEFENKLLMSQLISEIRKNPDHISITITGTGLIELTKTIQQVLHEEIEEEKNYCCPIKTENRRNRLVSN